MKSIGKQELTRFRTDVAKLRFVPSPGLFWNNELHYSKSEVTSRETS